MDRETFYTYFENAFFSERSQDIIKSKDRMKAKLGESAFIQNLLVEDGRREMLNFLENEYQSDGWESLVEFFVENGIMMLDVAGYYHCFGPNSLEELEIAYTEMLKEFRVELSDLECNIEGLQRILENQSKRLKLVLGKC